MLLWVSDLPFHLFSADFRVGFLFWNKTKYIKADKILWTFIFVAFIKSILFSFKIILLCAWNMRGVLIFRIRIATRLIFGFEASFNLIQLCGLKKSLLQFFKYFYFKREREHFYKKSWKLKNLCNLYAYSTVLVNNIFININFK